MLNCDSDEVCMGCSWMGIWAAWLNERCSGPQQGEWTGWFLEVPSNPNHSRILWFILKCLTVILIIKFHISSHLDTWLGPALGRTIRWTVYKLYCSQLLQHQLKSCLEKLDINSYCWKCFTLFTQVFAHFWCVIWSCLHKNKDIEISCCRVSLMHWGNFWWIKSSPVRQCPAVAPSHVQLFLKLNQKDFSSTQPPTHVHVCIHKGYSRFIHWQNF